jgi:hypothetical protein
MHLTRDDILEAVEQGEAGEAARHLATCPRCRDEVDGLRRTLDEVRAVDVPEPSPLFWEHLSRRVSEAVDREEMPGTAVLVRPLSWARRLVRPAIAVAAIIVAALLVERSANPPMGKPAPRSAQGTSAPPIELAAGEEWQFVVDVAIADSQALGETGFSLDPGSSELAISELSAEERRALVELLAAELGTPRETSPATRKGDV